MIPAFLLKYAKPIGGSAIMIIVALWFAFCRPSDAPIPKAEAHTIDSLATTKPFYLQARQELVLHETTFVAKAAKAESRATTVNTSADSIRAVADSLQHIAELQHDTSSAWRGAALARLAEADSLRVVVDSLHSALADERSARIAADAKAALDSARLVALDNLNDRLKRDVANAGSCNLLPFVRCPTRREAIVVGLALGAAAAYASNRK